MPDGSAAVATATLAESGGRPNSQARQRCGRHQQELQQPTARAPAAHCLRCRTCAGRAPSQKRQRARDIGQRIDEAHAKPGSGRPVKRQASPTRMPTISGLAKILLRKSADQRQRRVGFPALRPNSSNMMIEAIIMVGRWIETMQRQDVDAVLAVDAEDEGHAEQHRCWRRRRKRRRRRRLRVAPEERAW